jgi:hypothetical protein
MVTRQQLYCARAPLHINHDIAFENLQETNLLGELLRMSKM